MGSKRKNKTVTFPMLSQDDIMQASPEHYGKMVVTKDWNDNTIVAYGDTWDDAIKEAKAKGYRVVGKPGNPQTCLLHYCYAPCEGQKGITTTVDMGMVEGGCELCPICKYRKEK